MKEVWEEADGLDPSDFNPKTFFNLHGEISELLCSEHLDYIKAWLWHLFAFTDSNGDGYFDEQELEALFTKEVPLNNLSIQSYHRVLWLFLWGAKSDACVHHVQLEKVYDPTHEEDDMMEMEEERLRMREHVMNEVGATEFFFLLKILFQWWFTSNHVFILSIGRH